MFNNGEFLFQQDGAPAHTARSTQEWLKNETPGFLSKEEWPPSSPDLNPMDFSIWSILQEKACSKPHTFKTRNSTKFALKLPNFYLFRTKILQKALRVLHPDLFEI